MESYILPLIALLLGGAATGGLWWSLTRKQAPKIHTVEVTMPGRWPADERPEDVVSRYVKAIRSATGEQCDAAFIVQAAEELESPFMAAQRFITDTNSKMIHRGGQSQTGERASQETAVDQTTLDNGQLLSIRIVKCLGSAIHESMTTAEIAKNLGVDRHDVEKILSRFSEQFEYRVQSNTWSLK